MPHPLSGPPEAALTDSAPPPIPPSPAANFRSRRDHREHAFLIATLLIVFAAWLMGARGGGSGAEQRALEVLPGAQHIEAHGDLLLGYDASGALVGYAATGRSTGYGGPIVVLVGVDPAGQVAGMVILEEHETPGFFRRVESTGFLKQFFGAAVDAPLRLGEDLDGISGASLSAEGIAASTRHAMETISAEGLQQPRPRNAEPIHFGFPEITLIALYITGYFGHKHRSRLWKQRIRWATLLTGMIVLGFVYTMPVTIAHFIALLSGYWPNWHQNLYWYLLMGGILFVTTAQAKNPYCSWFCPFGAFQECLAVITGARIFKPRRWQGVLTWLPRILALVAIVLGLLLRQPGTASYEPFATLFDLRGNIFNWALLLLATLASLVMYRPFCNYLCPIDPVVDFIAAGRRWVRLLWREIILRARNASQRSSWRGS